MRKIYFIVPVYNVEKYLHRCINSVLSQTYENIELVLVDDGSPDRCGKICDEFAAQSSKTSVIHKTNGGLSDARNAGLNYCLGKAGEEDYITFLDSDDFVSESYGEKMIGLCEAAESEIAQCGYEKGSKDFFSEKVKVKNFVLESKEALLGYALKSQSWAKVYKVKIFKGLTFPKGVWNEDEFVTYKAVYRAKRIVFTTEKLHYYYQSGSSIMADIAGKLKNNPHKNDYLKAYEERAEFFKNADEPLQVMKTYEKVCTDIILRYSEQMYLKKEKRDEGCMSGEYIRLYRKYFKLMIKRKIPVKRKLMYICFYIFPYSAVLTGKIFTLRK